MKSYFLSALVCSIAASGFAVEALPRGQAQVQVNYGAEQADEESKWSLSMPNNFVGITAVETLTAGTFIGHWQAGLDPLAETDEVEFAPQEAYLNWRQTGFSVWGGRLPTLEQVFIEQPFAGLISQPNKGLVQAGAYRAYENKAARVDVTSGEYLTFAGQWVLDDADDDLHMSLATSLKTPDGSVGLTYRGNGDDEPIWGTVIVYQSQTLALSGVWFYQAEFLGTDLEMRFKNEGAEGLIGYSKDANDLTRWSFGYHRPLSQALTNFSEVMWWPSDERWYWSTGFQLQF